MVGVLSYIFPSSALVSGRAGAHLRGRCTLSDMWEP